MAVELINYKTNLIEYFNLDKLSLSVLLATELLSIRVKRNMPIGEKTFGDLEAIGLIFLTPSGQSSFLVSIPYFTFYLCREGVGPLSSTMPKLLRSTSTLLESRANEFLDISVLAMKLELLGSVMNRKTFKLSDLFPLHENAEDLEFKIPKFFRINEHHHQFNSAQEFGRHLTGLENDKYLGAMGAGNETFADSWIYLYPVSGQQRHVFYIQSKRRTKFGASATPGTNVSGSVEVEHAKCKFLPSRSTFIFITDDKERKATMPYEKNKIVVTSEKQEMFYGKCVALRKSNCI